MSIVGNLVEDGVQWLLDTMINSWMVPLAEAIPNVAWSAFYIESFAQESETLRGAGQALEVLRVYLVFLLGVKLLWKGWNVYVLWRQGDPDVAPAEMLIGAAQAIAVTVLMGIAYPLLVTISTDLVDVVLQALPMSVPQGIEVLPDDSTVDILLKTLGQGLGGTLLIAVVNLVLSIQFIILYFKLLWQGAELFIWRLAVPIAAVGLVNSDGGAWNNYAMLLIKQTLFLMLEYFCMTLGMRIAIGGEIIDVLLGIIFCSVAIGSSALLNQVLIPRGGSGVSQKLSTAAMMVRSFVR